MNTQTFFGFDFGTKRIGLAVGQIITCQARPLTTINYYKQQPNWAQIEKQMKEWRPGAFIVGIPYNMDGTEQNTTKLAKIFCQQCRKRFALDVHEMDERLSTIEARAQLFEQGGYKALQENEIDAYAAKLILESWFKTQ